MNGSGAFPSASSNAPAAADLVPPLPPRLVPSPLKQSEASTALAKREIAMERLTARALLCPLGSFTGKRRLLLEDYVKW